MSTTHAAQVHRLFFALQPDAATRSEIASVSDALKATGPICGRWLDASKYHVTLHFFGDHSALPTALVEQARRAATSVARAPFEFVLDQVSSFRGRNPSPCVLCCSPASERALFAFWKALSAALTQAGSGAQEAREFTPHVTLAYADKASPESLPVAPIRWPVRQFSLIDSLVGKSIHVPLDSWSLSS